MFVTNIGQENDRNYSHYEPASPPGAIAQTQPVRLDLSVMLAFGKDVADYKEGLKTLSGAIAYFNAYSLMTTQNVPEMPEPVSRISIEATNLTIQELSQLWSCFGGTYRPSVLYQIRAVLNNQNVVAGSPHPIRSLDADI